MKLHPRLEKSLPILLPTMLYLLVQIYSLKLGLNFEEGRDGVAYFQTLSDLLPYWDFEWMYGPLSFFVYSPLMRVFGEALYSLRWTYLTLSLTLIPLSYCLSRKLMPPFWASVSAFLCVAFIQIPYYTYNHIFQVIGFLAAFLFLAKYFENASGKFLVFAGLSTSLAILGKPLTPGVVLVGTVTFFLLTRLKPLVLYSFGWLVPTLSVFGILVYRAGDRTLSFLPFFAKDSILLVDQMPRTSPSFLLDLFLTRLRELFLLGNAKTLTLRFVHAYDALIANLFWVTALAVVFLLFYRRKADPPQRKLLLLLTVFSVLASFEGLTSPHVMWRAFTLQPALILLCFSLYSLARSKAIALLVATALTSIAFIYYPIGKARHFNQPLDVPRAQGILVSQSQKNLYESLFKKWGDGSKIAILGYFPLLGYLANANDIFQREHCLFLKLDTLNAAARTEPRFLKEVEKISVRLRDRIVSEMPEYIVTVQGLVQFESPETYLPEIGQLLRSSYNPESSFPNVDLFGFGFETQSVIVYKRRS